ncbi:MAG: GAF domain-containing protein [Promethearchaeota archaeon]
MAQESPPLHPDSVGVPTDHPPLTRFLGVPLKQAGRTVGMIGLANKESDYDLDDQYAIEALAVAFVEALHRKRAEKALEQRATQLALINGIGRQIASELELGSVLDRAARLVQESFGYHHVAIFTVDREREELVMRARAGAYSDLYPPEHRLSLGQGMVGWAASHGEMLLANNVRAEPLYVNLYPDRVPTLSELSVPLRMGKEILGVLDVQSPQLDAFDANDVIVMETLADQAAVAIRNSMLYEQVQRQLDELTLLNALARMMVVSLNPGTVMETTMDWVVEVLQTERGSVLLLDPESGELVFEAVYGRDAEVLKGHRLPPGKGIAGWVAQHGASAIVSDAQSDDRFYPEIDATMGFATRSVLCVPLVARGRVIGVMQVLNKIGGEFTEDDRRLLEALAATAGSAIENARLYEALEQERGSLAQRVRERTAELSAANAELARAARLKDEFLAAMSHELRTPLNAILGMAEVLEGGIYGQVNEQQIKAVQTIASSGDHLLTLINDVLDVAKIGAGTLELEVHPVSVEAVCQASLQFVRQAAAKKRLKVSSSFDGPVTTLQADERRLKQILVNLLSNSVKFTPEGGQIGLEVAGDAAKQVVHFTVWDTGIGISPEDRERLFQPFVQLDGSLSRRHQGTGLGLSLAYQLTEMHGGSIALESRVGQGSRFTVSLPWWEPGEEEAEERETREMPQRPIPYSSRPSATILLAEDNQSSIDTVFDYLLAHGYDVIVARNGVEAVDVARREHPDVILMDIQMPEMDGLEATRQIRADTTSGVATIPIIALTALAMPGDRERCLEAGADEYLSKPVSLRGLLDAIEGQLSVVAKA